MGRLWAAGCDGAAISGWAHQDIIDESGADRFSCVSLRAGERGWICIDPEFNLLRCLSVEFFLDFFEEGLPP